MDKIDKIKEAKIQLNDTSYSQPLKQPILTQSSWFKNFLKANSIIKKKKQTKNERTTSTNAKPATTTRVYPLTKIHKPKLAYYFKLWWPNKKNIGILGQTTAAGRTITKIVHQRHNRLHLPQGTKTVRKQHNNSNNRCYKPVLTNIPQKEGTKIVSTANENYYESELPISSKYSF